MTSLTGPDLLASWLLLRSIRDPGVPGSISGRGTRREYFLYRSISLPTTLLMIFYLIPWFIFSEDNIH